MKYPLQKGLYTKTESCYVSRAKEESIGHLDTKSLVVAVFQKEEVAFCEFEKTDFDFHSDFDFEKMKFKQADGTKSEC